MMPKSHGGSHSRTGKRRHWRCMLASEQKERASTELDEMVTYIAEAARLGELTWSEMFRGRLGQVLTIGVASQRPQQLVGMDAFMLSLAFFNGCTDVDVILHMLAHSEGLLQPPHRHLGDVLTHGTSSGEALRTPEQQPTDEIETHALSPGWDRNGWSRGPPSSFTI